VARPDPRAASPLSKTTTGVWPRGVRTDRTITYGAASRLSPVLTVERVLHAPRGRSPDVLIDLQGLPQVRSSISDVVIEEASAYSFQRSCLFARRAKLAGDGERVSVMSSGLLGRRGPQR
jgi:hypothetical protein